MDDFKSLELRLNRNTKTKLVLSLDGGGVRGIYQAKLLSLIIADYPNIKFDLICGTSIGSFIGAILAYRISNNPDSYFNSQNLNTILDKSILDHVMGIYQPDSVYDGKGKTKVLRSIFESKKMKEAKIPFVLTSYDLINLQPKIYTSWTTPDEDLTFVIDSSSSTPLYFPPVKKGDIYYTDGGVCINNPSLLAISKARQLYPYTDIKVLSLGTGLKPNFTKHICKLNWGPAGWLDAGIVDLLLDGPSQITNTIARDMIGSNYMRLDNQDISEIDVDDTSNESIELIRKAAIESYQQYKDKIKVFISF